MKGEECKVICLSKVSEITNGSMTRVNPEKITEDFANVLKDEVVGTNVDVKIYLHNGLTFTDEEP
jgi:hypothetical protein